MNRTDRLMAIIWLLQTRGRRTAGQLAEAFEISVRTVYRDIQALCEAGVPVTALPGEGGGYALSEPYRLSPIAFTAEEAEALWLGGTLVRGVGLSVLQAALDQALSKIGAVLRPQCREEAERLLSRVAVVLERRGSEGIPAETYVPIREALLDGRTLAVVYRDVNGTASERMVTPSTLEFRRGAWYLVGADSLSGGVRTFRVDRIHGCRLTEDPPVTAVAERVPTVSVRLRLPDANGRWYQEHPLFRSWNPNMEGEGRLRLEVPVPALNTLIATVLSFGDAETVEEPVWLVQRVIALAEAVIAAHRGRLNGGEAL